MAYQPTPINAWLAYTATPLAANQSWTTGWIDYNGYEGFTICRFADQNSATGGDSIETSVNAGAIPLPSTGGSYLATDMTKVSAFAVTRGTHIRYTFTNGPVAQTTCFIGIRANSGSTSPQMHTIFQNTLAAMTAALTKSALTIPDSPTVGGVFALITRTLNSLNVNVTNLPATQPVSGAVSVSNFPATPPTLFYRHPASLAGETRTLKAGAGRLKGVFITNPTAGTITIYDSTTGSGTVIAAITVAGTVPIALPIEANFTNGLTYVSASGPGDFTITWE